MPHLESHPHLHLFDPAKKWKYLIIGTFPPNTGLRDKTYIEYFYGNKGFLWKIIHDIYNNRGYDFFKGTKEENLSEIIRWQNDYCVGLSDTILQCRRKHPLSSHDSELTHIVYNNALKPYVIANRQHLKKIIFTSSFGKNSAFENFKRIMDDDLHLVQDILVTGLPSPSGAANITFFNTNNEQTLGLTDDFFQYVVTYRPDLLKEFETRWNLKKQKKISPSSSLFIPATPKGLVKAFKQFKYSEVLPQSKCI